MYGSRMVKALVRIVGRGIAVANEVDGAWL